MFLTSATQDATIKQRKALALKVTLPQYCATLQDSSCGDHPSCNPVGSVRRKRRIRSSVSKNGRHTRRDTLRLTHTSTPKSNANNTASNTATVVARSSCSGTLNDGHAPSVSVHFSLERMRRNSSFSSSNALCRMVSEEFTKCRPVDISAASSRSSILWKKPGVSGKPDVGLDFRLNARQFFFGKMIEYAARRSHCHPRQYEHRGGSHKNKR